MRAPLGFQWIEHGLALLFCSIFTVACILRRRLNTIIVERTGSVPREVPVPFAKFKQVSLFRLPFILRPPFRCHPSGLGQRLHGYCRCHAILIERLIMTMESDKLNNKMSSRATAVAFVQCATSGLSSLLLTSVSSVAPKQSRSKSSSANGISHCGHLLHTRLHFITLPMARKDFPSPPEPQNRPSIDITGGKIVQPANSVKTLPRVVEELAGECPNSTWMTKDHSVALPQGYGESKHVASLMLAAAAKQAGLLSTFVGCGQLAGATTGG